MWENLSRYALTLNQCIKKKKKKKGAKFTTSFTAKYCKLTIVVVAGKNKSRQKRVKVATFAHTINLKRWDTNQPLIPLFR